MNHAFNLIPFWGLKHYTGPASLPIRQFVHVDDPLRMFFYPLSFHIGELYNKVDDRLSLYGSTGAVLYVKFTQFYCP